MRYLKNNKSGKLFMFFSLWLFVISCGNGGGTKSDGGDEVTVKYETCPPCNNPPLCLEGEVLSCCACVKIPSNNAGRTSCNDMSDYCGEGEPDISCLRPDGYPQPRPPQQVSVHGIVDVYATGPASTGVKVEFYEEAENGQLGSLLGMAVSEDTCEIHQAELPVPHEVGDELRLCPGICVEKNADTEDCRKLAYFEIPDTIPTNTPLIVKTSGDTGIWKDMVTYNVWFFDNDVEQGKVFYKARILSVDDWRLIPGSAGDPSGIAPGKSAVAGEIHDCSDVRIYFATTGTNPRPTVLTYFNGEEDKLYPDRGRTEFGTNLDGLYAAIEVEANTLVYVTALASIPREGIVNLGWRVVQTFPDTLTSVSIKGTRPDQVPQ